MVSDSVNLNLKIAFFKCPPSKNSVTINMFSSFSKVSSNFTIFLCDIFLKIFSSFSNSTFSLLLFLASQHFSIILTA